MVRETPDRTTEGAPAGGPASSAQILDQYLVSGIVAIDERQRITAFSPDTGKLLGLTVVEALHQSSELLPGPLRNVLHDALSRGESAAISQITLPGPAGLALVVRVSTALLQGADGKTLGAIAVLNDVTPAGHLDQNLRKLDRLASIGMLSASMAHEIKNAMVAVKTFVDLLIKKNQDTSLAGIVGREMTRIDSIVSQMLRLAGPARPTFGVIHLHPIIEQSLSLVQHHLEGRRIRLTASLRAEPDTLRGDVYQLEQAFINLFFNALDAMGAHGELNVATEFVPTGGPDNPHAPVLRVAIRDTGVGIPPENLERLFDPFFTTKPHGTGLGLPITRRIVQEHRGIITVASELNNGTTFTLLLPTADSAMRQP
jgi:signal transduction histidine kinase